MDIKQKQAERLNENFFNQSCDISGDVGWRASCYLDEHMQTVYYHSILKNFNNFSSVLDVGCGQGDFLSFIRQRKYNAIYKGIDVSESMIKYSRTKFPKEKFEKISLLDLDEEKYDLVVGIGTFNIKLENDDYQIEYFLKNIKKMYSICNKACAFTLLSNHGYEQASKEKNLFCYEPHTILKHCMELTDCVLLDHSSIPVEFIVILYKD